MIDLLFDDDALELIDFSFSIFDRYSANHFLALFNQKEGRNEFLCEKCGRACSTTVELIQHSDEFHIKKRKPTEVTSEAISSRPYLCDICGKGYTQSSHLYQHLRFHKGKRRQTNDFFFVN